MATEVKAGAEVVSQLGHSGAAVGGPAAVRWVSISILWISDI